MKMLLSLFVLLTVVACGQQGTNTSLEVTQGFAISSAGFDGGLIVSGHNLTTGQRFSSSMTTGTSLNLTLPNGQWKFYAMGWPTAFMSGTPKCAKADASLGGTATNVSLVVKSANCNAADFGYGTPFTVATCGAFYEWSGSSYLHVPGSSVSSNFCSTLPLDLQGIQYASTKIIAVNSALGAADGTQAFSSCNNNTGPMNLPRLNVPLALELYDSSSCTGKVINRFYFPAGIANGSSNFDSVVFTSLGSDFLALPNNQLRRAYSPFMAELPKIACSSGECLGRPANVPGQHFIQPSGGSTLIYAGLSNGATSCTIGTVTGSFSASNCRIQDGQFLIDVSTSCATTDCNGTVQVNVSAVTVATVGVWATDRTELHNAYNLFESVWESVGLRNIDTATKDFFSVFSRDDKIRYYGELSQAREILSPDGPAGALAKFGSSCDEIAQAAPFSRTISFRENGIEKNYRVDISNAPVTFNGFLCQLNATTNCDSALFPASDLTMSVYKVTATSTQLETRLHLKCDAKVGILESADNEVGQGKRGNKLYWNTDDAAEARYESFSIEYQANSRYRASAERFQAMGTVHFNKRRVSFESEKISTFWSQRAHAQEVLREQPSSQALISFQNSNENISNAVMDGLTSSAIFAMDSDFFDDADSDSYNDTVVPANNCFNVGTNTTIDLQNTTGFASINVGSGCSPYANRTTEVHAAPGVDLKLYDLRYSQFKQLFPLAGLP